MTPSLMQNNPSHILETGSIRMKIGNQLSPEIPYNMHLLDESQLDAVMRLQATIFERLSRKDMMQPFSVDFMRSHFTDKGFVIGISVGQELVAFRNVYYPDHEDPKWNLARDLELMASSAEPAGNLQLVCVHPLYRGNGLALKMNRRAIRIIREQRRCHHLLATVSPYNYWNVGILLSSGFAILALKTKYNGKLRYIVYQNLQSPATSSPPTDQVTALTDFTQQEKLFREGFHAFRLCESPGPHFPISEITETRQIRQIPDRFELHFSRQPVPGFRRNG